MANTFAEHILGLAGRGSREVEVHERSVEEDLQQDQCSPDSSTSSASSTDNGNPLTYASVVLMMAMGVSSNPVEAATDGALATGGGSSSGRVGISMSIPERIDVQGLRSVALAADAEGAYGEVRGCISGHGSTHYRVAVSGGVPEAMALRYTAGEDSARPLTMGQALQQLHGAGAQGCAQGTSNAKLAVRLPDINHRRGALTLLISPE